ncbi:MULTISPECIES: hypothetical protein [Campylobacter]|uniref:hypothetical protein n=1 Tax=Campylobacter TaxID=194 RepID=UPI001276DA23|nr:MULTISPECIES: hypothetical protein [Campylobacter]MBT0741956.1 hypothetical protein [Campylobacter lari]MCR6520866.1 hypothetical protein [Campylobacter lari]MCV3397339.1 hypothetical protein [Campylobacter sp. RKI_CA19_01116]MCV3431476.1 hypothetical protein [Campylobacter lari]MCV3442891.1 hypothetical protein [Campylobacter sp. IFREMER_LSEM_CL1097]
MRIDGDNNKLIPTKGLNLEELGKTSLEAFEKIGRVMADIELNKQQTALAQIEATKEDNQKQYEFAKDKLNKDNAKWHKSMNIASIAVFILLIVGLYLIIFTDKIDIGLGLLSTTVAGVFGYLAGVGSSKTSQ